MDNKNTKLYQSYLFNFSSSYTGGGLKRLMAYITWFNNNGGAHFIVNKKLKNNLKKFSTNTYHYVDITSLQKLINDQKYVDTALKEMYKCSLYYSYNIPLKKNNAQVKWFHLSNVLPFSGMSKFNIPYRRRIELIWLGILTRRGFKFCDYISAESKFSLNLLELEKDKKLSVSVNGSNDEINLIASLSFKGPVKNIAVMVGTYHHKNVFDSYKIYKYLRLSNKHLNLLIVGDADTVPTDIKNDPQVELLGMVNHSKIFDILSNARYYINTSKIENSWNAASEGVYLAKESFISKIPPHNELLRDSQVELLSHMDTFHTIMKVSRDNLQTNKLKTWNEVIKDMISLVTKN